MGAVSIQHRGCMKEATSALCFLYLIGGKLAVQERDCRLIRVIVL